MNGKHDSKGARTCHVTVSMSRDDVTVHDDLLMDLHSSTRIWLWSNELKKINFSERLTNLSILIGPDVIFCIGGTRLEPECFFK